MIELLDEVYSMSGSEVFGAADDGMPPRVKRRTPRILVAEDDEEMRRFLSEALRRAGYAVVEAEHGIRVLDYIASGIIAGDGLDADLVISDIRMPGADGLRLLTALRSHRHNLPVILITAFGNPETHCEALRRGARAVIDKPFEFDALLAHVRRALRSADDEA